MVDTLALVDVLTQFFDWNTVLMAGAALSVLALGSLFFLPLRPDEEGEELLSQTHSPQPGGGSPRSSSAADSMLESVEDESGPPSEPLEGGSDQGRREGLTKRPTVGWADAEADASHTPASV